MSFSLPLENCKIVNLLDGLVLIKNSVFFEPFCFVFYFALLLYLKLKFSFSEEVSAARDIETERSERPFLNNNTKNFWANELLISRSNISRCVYVIAGTWFS